MGLIFSFDHAHRQSPMELKGLLGGKGANLAEMTSVLGLPVPPGFTISTDACRAYLAGGWPEGLSAELTRHIRRLEKKMGRRLGDPNDPLLVSVRSGAEISMPGMMDTILNLGLNDASVKGLTERTGDERFAYDSYCRFVSMYGRIVFGIDGRQFDELFEELTGQAGASGQTEPSAPVLARLVERYQELIEAETGTPFPQAPLEQLQGAIEAVFRSWNAPRAVAYREREHIDHHLGTAVTVQAMVFGNRDNRSGTGVGFTRDPATGDRTPYGDFLVNAQGEDVVAGIRNTLPLSAIGEQFPEIYKELKGVFAKLEAHYRDMCDTEFTIEQGKLWMLQTRVGKRTGKAALKMAVEMTRQRGWRISREEAVGRVSAEHIDQLLHPQFAERPANLLGRGLAASPGAAVGKAVFSAAEAIAAGALGERVILVRNETSPDDIAGMIAAQGILTTRGGLVSHAAVVARGWGKPAVVGADQLRITDSGFTLGGQTVTAGEYISIDGNTGEIALGEVALAPPSPPNEMELLLGWADRIRKGKLSVRANADTGTDAATARSFGAEGIGLCRTEHMFLEGDRLPIVRRMILASDGPEEQAALEELREAQREDFEAILEAMDGLPVTVRLLDPPLHEFLPSIRDLELKEATVGLDEQEKRLLAAARAWQELNPMLGLRGVRLGIVKPRLYEMQVSALLQAAAARVAAGGHPKVEVMIPLTVTRGELALARSWVETTIAEETKHLRRKPQVQVGTMIETPRAALRADELAEEADFFSFGTNDLTQMTFGLSRDDVEGRLMNAYLELGLLEHNPFENIDDAGVGELVRLAADRGRAAHPGLKIGICGEHGGDPTSIGFFYREVGLDYVSCSPFRVPVARLAAAQAVLGEIA